MEEVLKAQEGLWNRGELLSHAERLEPLAGLCDPAGLRDAEGVA